MLDNFKKFSGLSEKKIKDSFQTPYILEERKLNVTALDIFSRMLYDRIVYFGTDFNEDSCNTTICQLLYLSSVSNDDINIYINSPGGSVSDGLALIDVMNYIPCDVSTTCVGMSASMGAVLLSSGAKGKRNILPNSRVMIHQPSGGYRGTAADIKIQFEEMEKCKKTLYEILANNMVKSYEEIEVLCDRDSWFGAEEAVNMGLVDNILVKKK
jgi:ATP-dependent Clp protease protease subunit